MAVCNQAAPEPTQPSEQLPASLARSASLVYATSQTLLAYTIGTGELAPFTPGADRDVAKFTAGF